MNFGIPYMGSKNKIAEWVLSYIPQRANLYDLFCGGCAITHAAMLSMEFENIFINDIQEDLPQLFIDAIQGKYRNETRWISREDFFKFKDTDAYIRYVWSFGSKGANYIYGKDREDFKKALHYAIVLGDTEPIRTFGLDLSSLENYHTIKDREIEYRRLLKEFSKKGICVKDGSHYTYNRMKGVDILQNLNASNRLNDVGKMIIKNVDTIENLSRTNRLNEMCVKDKSKVSLYKGDYQNVPIVEDSVIYCDIPYKSTGTYKCKGFDYERFYSWCELQKELVVISEYDMPRDKFYCIAEIIKKSTLSPTSNNTVSYERLFVPLHQIDMYKNENNTKKQQLNLF